MRGRMTVLLTRPQADAERVAMVLRPHARVIVSPLMRIVFAGDLPQVGTALLTSANGVAAWVAAGGARGLPCWTVGPRTAQRAAAAGFGVQGVAEDAAALAAMVPVDVVGAVHLRGAEQRGDLVVRLRARGIAAVEAVIYRQEAVDPTDAARSAVEAGPVVLPLWSPRSAALAFGAFGEALWPNLRPVCLSGAVADTCPVPAVAVAARPDGEAMMRTILAILGAPAVEGDGGTV